MLATVIVIAFWSCSDSEAYSRPRSRPASPQLRPESANRR